MDDDAPYEGQIAETSFTFVGKDGFVFLHITIAGLFEKTIVLRTGEMEDLIVLADVAVQQSKLTEEDLAEQQKKNIKEMN